MSIIRVEDNLHTNFNRTAPHPLQSWEWGNFRREAGNGIARLAETKNNKLINSYQLTTHKIPLTNYKVGTLIKSSKPTKSLIQYLKKFTKEEKLIFIKIEPNTFISSTSEKEKTINLLRENGAVKGKTLFTPTTFWLDLTKTEDELMKGFSSKTRYNIRLSKRKGVKVVEDNSNKAFEKYISLTRQTVERQGFYAHTEKYHRLMWKYLHTNMVKRDKNPIARLLVAKYNNQIITTWILFVWHNFLYYPYGASSDQHKNVMANNLMMWEAIRYGKKLDLKTFDLWGREPGRGFTKFKEGYSPQVVKLLGTWDLITSPLYYPYKLAETIRWSLLRLRAKISLTKPNF